MSYCLCNNKPNPLFRGGCGYLKGGDYGMKFIAVTAKNQGVSKRMG